MNCPHCNDTKLVMADRVGVEIDYCPTCRGVWLDRGELDKILDRAAGDVPQAVTPPPRAPYQASPRPDYARGPDDSHHGYPSPYGHRKKKSWLSEILD